MTGVTIEDIIRVIVESSKNNLFYLCTDTGHMPNDQKFPIVLCTAETSSIEDWDGVDRKKTRVFDVTMTILEKSTENQLVDDGKGMGGTTKETVLAYNLRVAVRRKELIGIMERIVYYLTAGEFGFNFEVNGPVEFSRVNEQQSYGLVGLLCDFSVSFPCSDNPCCVDFDEAAIKAYK